MSAPGLTENHERSLLASSSYASKLIRDSAAVVASADRPDPFDRYAGTLTPPQIRIMYQDLVFGLDSGKRARR